MTIDAPPPGARPLTELQRSIVRRLLEPAFPGVEGLRSQLDHALATPCDVCGTCPSFGIWVDRTAVGASTAHRGAVANGVSQRRPSLPVWAILWVDAAGYLDSVEIAGVDDGPERELPDPRDLAVKAESTSSAPRGRSVENRGERWKSPALGFLKSWIKPLPGRRAGGYVSPRPEGSAKRIGSGDSINGTGPQERNRR